MLFCWAAGWHSQMHTAQFSYLAQFETVPGYSLTGTPRSLTGVQCSLLFRVQQALMKNTVLYNYKKP